MPSNAEQIDRLVVRLVREAMVHPSREKALAITNLQQARMWLEEDLRHNEAPA